jgi:hypothetical protein
MHEITTYIKDVLRTLRELKKSSGLAFEMLKLLSDGQESSIVIAFFSAVLAANLKFRFLLNISVLFVPGYVESQGAQSRRLQLEW